MLEVWGLGEKEPSRSGHTGVVIRAALAVDMILMEAHWIKILEILKNTTNPGLFHIWLKPLEAAIDAKSLHLMAPNEFVAGWVRNKFQEPIAQAAEAVLGVRPDIAVTVRPANILTRSAEVSVAEDSPAQVASFSVPQQLSLPMERTALFGGRRSWRFSFEDFVVGPCNEFAYASTKGIADSTFGASRLFISSPPGLGKTHLLHALGRHICAGANREFVRIEYMTAEQFASQLVAAIKTKTMEDFKTRLREGLDLLLLEDIHFLQGKHKIQEELLSTLKALRDRNAKVVMTSCFLPRELKEVDGHLTSRLCAGSMAVIEKPDFETRRMILLKKAQASQTMLPGEVTDLVAERITSDVRMLESCLTNMILKARLLNRPIGLDLAMEVMADYAQDLDRVVDLEAIVKFVCKSYGLNKPQLDSKSRGRQVVQARNAIFYLARKYTELSLKDIGEVFNRKHSTVLKGIANVEREIGLETPLGRQIAHTESIFKQSGRSVRA